METIKSMLSAVVLMTLFLAMVVAFILEVADYRFEFVKLRPETLEAFSSTVSKDLDEKESLCQLQASSGRRQQGR